MSVPVSEIRKNKREVARITLDQFNGYQLLNVRVWFAGEDGEMKPDKSGFALRVDLLPMFSHAIGKALDEARKQGLVA